MPRFADISHVPPPRPRSGAICQIERPISFNNPGFGAWVAGGDSTHRTTPHEVAAMNGVGADSLPSQPFT